MSGGGGGREGGGERDHLLVSLSEATFEEIIEQLRRRYDAGFVAVEGKPGRPLYGEFDFFGGHSRAIGMLSIHKEVATRKAADGMFYGDDEEAEDGDGV